MTFCSETFATFASPLLKRSICVLRPNPMTGLEVLDALDEDDFDKLVPNDVPVVLLDDDVFFADAVITPGVMPRRPSASLLVGPAITLMVWPALAVISSA